MQKLIILRGLPGSGKTTWCKEYIKENLDTFRVSRDDIRSMLTPVFKHGAANQELLVSDIENQTIKGILESGYSCIVDATNFRGIGRFSDLVSQIEDPNIKIEIKEFDTDIKTCIQRDQQRENPVGKEVIERMYNKYMKNATSKDIS